MDENNFEIRKKKRIVTGVFLLLFGIAAIVVFVVISGGDVSEKVEKNNTATTESVELFEEKELISFKGYRLLLNNSNYTLTKNRNSSYFGGEYKIKEATGEYEGVDLSKYQKVFELTCFFGEHHYGTEHEYCIERSDYLAFKFLLCQNTENKYEIIPLTDLSDFDFNKNVF